MAILSLQRPTKAGTQVTLAAAAGGGDSFPNDGRTIFRVANGSGGAITVTFPCTKPCSFGVTSTAHDAVVSVPAGQTWDIGPFSQDQFNDVNGRVQVTYSAVTSLTVGALTL